MSQPQIHTIDLQYLGLAGAIASYLIRSDDGAAIIECGPGSTRDNLVNALRHHGVAPGDVRDVVVSHIHLDHAGSAGWWAQQGATIHVHEFGAKHLVNPEKLIASATRIYGDLMDRLWGDILPAPEDRVHPVHDGDTIRVAGGVELRAIETPGHARHHHAFATNINDERMCFTGDAAAMIVPGHRFISIPTPPPEFDLEQWLASIDRLEKASFDALYLTHFGRIDDPADHIGRLRPWLIEQAEFVRDHLDAGRTRDQILTDYTTWMRSEARADGLSDEALRGFLTSNLMSMNVDGMTRYFTK